MATYTSYLNLKKPDQTDSASILDINGNMDTIDTAIKDMWKTIYPVGSIYLSTANTSPATLFGGTWVQIKDKFLLSAGDSYPAGGTGGAAIKSYTPAGTVGNHTLTTSEIPSHSHGLNSHVHTLGNHVHSLNSHKHTIPSHTHGVGTLAVGSAGNHVHGITGINSYNRVASYHGNDKNGDWGNGNTLGENVIGIASAGAHTHTLSGATASGGNGETGAASGNTGAVSGNTGAASGNTANAGGGGAHNHGFTGTEANINVMPPYYTVYMWRRTA